MRAIVLVLLTGCRQLLGFEQPVAGDGGIVGDDSDIAGDGSNVACIGAVNGLLPNTCFTADDVLDLDGAFDTATDPRCSQEVTEHCIAVAGSIVVSGDLQVRGTRALVLWSATTIQISGTLDVASHVGGKSGPGSDPSTCDVLDGGSAGSSPIAGAGGSGGSYAGLGGAGGIARSGASLVSNPELGLPVPVALRGGCPGGRGGTSIQARPSGGGALYVMARDQISVSGSITASGEGGNGGIAIGNILSGGGGGGSGGLIGLDAPMIALEGATLTALGGGGGSGAGNAVSGNAGADPTAQPGLGGAQVVSSNRGGSGGDASGGPGDSGGNVSAGLDGAGGGGGGGPGYIRVFGFLDDRGSVLAPPAS